MQYLYVVTSVYNQAMRKKLEIGLVTACLGCIEAVFMEWKSVKNRPQDTAAN